MTKPADRDAAGRIARRQAKAQLAKTHAEEYRTLIARNLKALGFGPGAPARKTTARKPRTAKK